MRSDGRHESKLYVDSGPSSTQTVGVFRMKGREVFEHAVGLITDVIVDAFNATGLTTEDVAGSSRIRPTSESSMLQRAVLLHREDGVDRRPHGDTSAASIPLALAVAVEHGHVEEGDFVLFEAHGWQLHLGLRARTLVSGVVRVPINLGCVHTSA